MLGRYDFFPDVFHGRLTLRYKVDVQAFQLAILNAMLELNGSSVKLSELSGLTADQEINVSFEFGFAEGRVFTFIDPDEAEFISRKIEEKPFSLMDFFSVLKYYRKTVNRKSRPLKFDYGIIRFSFGEEVAVVKYFHERGTRRVSFSSLIAFILDKTSSILGVDGGEVFEVADLVEV
ncbi:hypothetical protein J7L06_04435 [Candidatus Bathyarchaeota archaeon]|nr:hypothetical protein [Candidatus Bathyarchaeota archaeon]